MEKAIEAVVQSVVRRYRRPDIRDDLLQEGRLAAWRARVRHNPTRGPLLPHVRVAVALAVQRHIDRHGQAVRLPVRHAQERRRRLRDGDTEDLPQYPTMQYGGTGAGSAPADDMDLADVIAKTLTPAEQEVLARKAAGDAHLDIAAAMDVPPRHVTRLLRAARRKMQAVLSA